MIDIVMVERLFIALMTMLIGGIEKIVELRGSTRNKKLENRDLRVLVVLHFLLDSAVVEVLQGFKKRFSFRLDKDIVNVL